MANPTPDNVTVEVIGQRVKAVRPLTEQELAYEGWQPNPHHSPSVAVELENGTTFYASRDDEGNGPGTLLGRVPGGTGFYVAELAAFTYRPLDPTALQRAATAVCDAAENFLNQFGGDVPVWLRRAASALSHAAEAARKELPASSPSLQKSSEPAGK